MTADDLAELSSAAQGVTAASTDRPDPGQQLSLWDFVLMQRKLYPYELTESEQREWNITQGTGQFFIDRDGVVRWTKVQSTSELGSFASEAELLVSVQTVIS